MLYGVADMVHKKSTIAGNIVSYISIHSVPIIALHFLAFKIVNLFAVLAYGFKFYMIAAFPVLMRTELWWALYTVVGIGVPLLLQRLYSLSKMCIVDKWRLWAL